MGTRCVAEKSRSALKIPPLPRDHEVWDTCHADLMRRTVQRLEQESSRLGGDCAHVISESIEPKHDAATSEAWLHGRFEYALYRIPSSN